MVMILFSAFCDELEKLGSKNKWAVIKRIAADGNEWATARLAMRNAGSGRTSELPFSARAPLYRAVNRAKEVVGVARNRAPVGSERLQNLRRKQGIPATTPIGGHSHDLPSLSGLATSKSTHAAKVTDANPGHMIHRQMEKKVWKGDSSLSDALGEYRHAMESTNKRTRAMR
jgi:hypothetical protein